MDNEVGYTSMKLLETPSDIDPKAMCAMLEHLVDATVPDGFKKGRTSTNVTNYATIDPLKAQQAAIDDAFLGPQLKDHMWTARIISFNPDDVDAKGEATMTNHHDSKVRAARN